MKLRLNKSLRRALLMSMLAIASVSSSSLADVYVRAEGVDFSSVTGSERFYDHGKGYVAWRQSSVVSTVNSWYAANRNLDIIGDLEDRMPAYIGSVSSSSFDNLKNDSMHCWAATVSNQIQYWQSYYGVLYTGSKELPHGYTYDEEALTSLQGVQSLQIGMLFYDNWYDQGGNGYYSVNWYFNGAATPSGWMKPNNEGGYWKGAAQAAYVSLEGRAMTGVRDELLKGLGYTKTGYSNYELTEKGRLVYLSVHWLNVDNGHAITCYGVILNDDGSLKAVQVADSDDTKYGLTTYYLKKDANGYTRMYQNEACTIDAYNSPVHLTAISYIETSSAFKNALEKYYDEDTPLRWTGNASTWQANATPDVLPDAESGWSVTVGYDTYNSFFHQGRKVIFDDAGLFTSVGVVGDVKVSEMVMDNSSYSYYFDNKGNGSIEADLITATGSSLTAFYNLNVTAGRVAYSNYTMALRDNASLTTQSYELGSNGVLCLSQGSLKTNQLTMGAGSRIEITASNNTLEFGSLRFDGSATLYIGSLTSGSTILSLSGNSVGGGTFDVVFANNLSLTGTSYELFDLEGNDSIWEGLFTTSSGGFEIIDGVLYYSPAQSMSWTVGDGVWSSSQWNGQSQSTAHEHLSIARDGDFTITVQGKVSADKLQVSNASGTVTLAAADSDAAIEGSMSITKTNGGTLQINGANTFSGGITLAGGTLVAGHNQAFGTGTITISNGTLQLKGKSCRNHLEITGEATVKSGYSYAGGLTLNGGNLKGDMLALVSEAKLLSGSVSLSLMGYGGVRKSGSGTVTLKGSNSYGGDTWITEGELIAAHSSAFGNGSGSVYVQNAKLTLGASITKYAITSSGNSTISVSQGTEWSINAPITNTGTLTLSGSIKADALEVSTVSSGRVDEFGNHGSNGFAVNASFSTFTLVEGGTTLAEGLTLTHNGTLYSLGQNGVAVAEGAGSVDYSSYLANTGHSVRLSEARRASDGKLYSVQLRGGTLYVDEDINYVDAQGGTIYLERGVMGGYLPSATVYASGGTMQASMHGSTSFTGSGDMVLSSESNNSHTGGTTLNGGYFIINHCNFFGQGSLTTNGITTLDSEETNFTGGGSPYTNIRQVIQNSGSLMMLGVFNASELPLISEGEQYVDTEGRVGESGFLQSTGFRVQLVEGGELAVNATVIHGDKELVLRDDGYAYLDGGEPEYERYFLSGSDSVYASVAEAYSSGALEEIIMTGGTLNADVSVRVSATAGVVNLSEGTLSGAVNDAIVHTSGGELSAALSGVTSLAASGSLILSGDNSHTGGNEFTDASIALSHAHALGQSSVQTSGTTTVSAVEAVELRERFINSGTLTLNGIFIVDSFEPSYSDDWSYVSVSGGTSDSGFRRYQASELQIVEGGELLGNASVQYQGNTYHLESDGCVYFGDSVNITAWDTYYLNGTDSVRISEAMAQSAGVMANVVMTGGTLYADESIHLAASGGDIKLQAGTISGTIADARIEATGGELCATLSGNTSIHASGGGLVLSGANSHSGGNYFSNGTYQLKGESVLGQGSLHVEGNTTLVAEDKVTITGMIQNSGVLTLSGGTFDLTGIPIQASTYYGYLGTDGYFSTSGVKVTLLGMIRYSSGGELIVEDGAEVTYEDGHVWIWKGGIASTRGYGWTPNVYVLNSGDSVLASDAKAWCEKLSTNPARIMVTGGLLECDTSVMVEAAGGTIHLTAGDMSGTVANTRLQTEGGTVSAVLSGSTSLEATGSLTLSRDNTHTGGNIFTDAAITLNHDHALGQGPTLTNGNTSITSAGTVALHESINNTGVLTLHGTFIVDSLTPETPTGWTYISVSGKEAASGFKRALAPDLRVVSGGVVQGDALVQYQGISYHLDAAGKLVLHDDDAATEWDTYYLNSSDSVRISEAVAFSSGAMEKIVMAGGTLYADADSSVNATGGLVELSAGTLSGSIADTRVNATGGELAAALSGSASLHASEGTLTLSGNNTHTGGTYLSNGVYNLVGEAALGRGKLYVEGNTTLRASGTVNINGAIQSSGSLTLSGDKFNFTSLSITRDYQTYVGTNGDLGTSGIALTIPYMIRVTNGGEVFVEDGTRITYNSSSVQLYKCGIGAVTAQYYRPGVYVLNSGDTVMASAAIALCESYLSSGTISYIDIRGGILKGDASVKVQASGGHIHLTAGELSGSVQDTVLQTEAGVLSASLSGATSLDATGLLTLSGDNTHTGNNVFTDAIITLDHAHALGYGSVTTAGNTVLNITDKVALHHVIHNSGLLIVNGCIDASGLSMLDSTWQYRDVNGVIGNSGFVEQVGARIQVVEGGAVLGNAQVLFGDTSWELGSDGYAVSSEENNVIAYDKYYLNGTDSVSVSAAESASANALATVCMTGGTLYADASIRLEASGGSVVLSGGTLSGTIGDTQVTAEGGVLSAGLSGSSRLSAGGTVTISGANTHTGGTVFNGGSFTLGHASALGTGSIMTQGANTLNATTTVQLSSTILNSGSLTLNGVFDVSALTLAAQSATYVDAAGNTGTSGFRKASGYQVQVVNGGTVSGNATIKHGSRSLSLGSDGYATSGGGVSYATYYLNSGDSVSVSAAEAASANALTSVSMSGGSLYADASTRVTSTGGHILLSSGSLSGSVKNADVAATGGTLSAVLSGSSSLSAGGAVTISGANTHTGGTLFNGGTFTLSHASALGSGSIMTQGSNTLTATTLVRLSSSILNSGSLTLNGVFDVSALTLAAQSATYVDAAGNTGTSGFRKAGGYQVQVVNGGAVSGSAIITHGSNTLALGSDGYAAMGGEVDYHAYYLQGTDSVSVSAAMAASSGALTSVSMSGGTLHVDDSMMVKATGGQIQLTSGTLSGSVSGEASISASGGGCIASANTHTGGTVFNGGSFALAHAAALGNGTVVTMGTTALEAETTVALKSEILNSGELSLSGVFDVSSLALNSFDVSYVDAAGNAGGSGFAKSAGYSVQVVNGGSVSGNATFRHGSHTLTLGSDGLAVLGGGVAYDTYYLNSGDVVSASAARKASADALSNISMSGGNLYADTSIVVNATGGQIQLLNGTLSGSARNATITAREGTISAELGGTSRLLVQGNVKVSGNNTYTGGTVLNEGVLEMTHAHALGTGNVTLVDGRLRNSGSAPTNITAGTVTLKGSVLEGRFTLDGSSSWDVRSNTEIQGSLALEGGLLQLHSSSLNVSDTLVLGNATIELDASYVEGNTYTLLSAGNISGSVFALELQGASSLHCLKVEDNALVLRYMSEVAPTGAALQGSNLTKDDKVVIEEAGSIVLEGSVAPGAITVAADTNVTLASNKKAPGSLTGDGNLSKSGGGTLTLNEDNSSWTGDTCLNGGGIKVKGDNSLGQGDVYVENGTLDLSSKAVGNDIVQTGTGVIKGGKKFTGTYTLEEGAELMKGSTLDIATSATLSGGVVSGSLSGSGQVNVTGEVILSDNGKISTNALSVNESGFLTVSAKGLSMNAKTSTLTLDGGSIVTQGKLSGCELDISNGGSLVTSSAKPVALSFKGDFEASGLRDEDGEIIRKSTISIYGGFTASSLSLTDSDFRLEMNAGMRSVGASPKAQTVNINGKNADNAVDDSELVVAGKMSVTGNLELKNNSFIRLYDPSGKNAAMPLAVKGNFTLGSGCSLTLSGALSAANLTVDGACITMTSSKPQTIKVSKKLTLNSGSTIDLSDCSFEGGKSYKLATFKEYEGLSEADLYSVFGITAGNGIELILDDKKSITLTLGKGATWNPVFDKDDESDEPGEIDGGTPGSTAVLVTAPDLSPVADALVQANWGQVEASRAFVNAIGSRSMTVQLGSGERAVWAGAIGASSRHSAAGGHNGADTNVTGGALGVETQLCESSLLGVALGSSRTRVSAHNYGTIKQDTTHLGLYGQTNWNKLSADWSAAYGRSDSEIHDSSWKQNHLQLDGRVSYDHALSSSTVLRGFGGMQYYASDSATVDGIKTGSIQNLRAEIGVGASHAIGKLGVYGEVAVHQDLVRHNPTVTTPDARYRGMNPGRTGLNFTVGASYSLTDQWSVNASYTGEIVENANAHSASVGATYKF